ncbi:MAG: hypothetical protein QG629_577 [Patescibacteria group bacterium]|nr:hypothetical protein [Patescibacteria group bacterium]
MNLALSILIIGVCFNLFVAGLVSLKRQDSSARILGLVAAGLIAWEVANYLADADGTRALFWNMVAFVGPLLVIVPSYYFVKFIKEQKVKKMFTLFISLGTLIISAISFTPLIVQGVVPRISNGMVVGYDPEYGPLYLVYITWVVFLVLVHAKNILPSSKEYDERFAQQMHLIRVGTVVAILIPLITNLVLPNILESSVSAKFVPLMSIVYMGALSIAILKHKMLDIRTFVFRAAAYALTMIILGLLYVAPIIYVIAHLLGGINIFSWEFAGAVVAGTLAATNYQRLRNWFNRATNRIFFRDAYDPTEMVADLNRSLVGVIDVHKLLSVASDVVESNLNPEFCYFVLRTSGSEQGDYRLVGGKKKRPNDATVARLLPVFETKLHSNTTYADLLESKSSLKALFTDADIAAVLRLLPTGAKKESAIGYMVVGVRKSGKAYDQTDAQVLETVASTLIIAIQNALNFEEIQQFNVTLQQKVDEATRKYRAANERLKQLDETKDEFISMASHQLRTPLTSVKGYLSMVLDGDVGKISKAQEELLKQSFLSSQRMVSLIADLLNLSRLNTGKFVIDATPVDLRDVINSEIMQLKETARAKNIDLQYENPAEFPTLMLDETKIHQVVMNFIDNALYYTPAGGKVVVSLVNTPHHVEFRVKDNGIGVPREQQKHLFTKFYRAENAKRARPDGTGLGIFMAKKVVVAQNGAILFESEEGKGSMFGFRFNKSTASTPASLLSAEPKHR